MGLGKAERTTIAAAGASLKRARDQAHIQRQLLDAGKDPLAQRRAARQVAKAEACAATEKFKSDALTLCRAARDYHERVVEPKFTDKHSKLWIASLENNVPAEIWHKPIDQIMPVELFEAIAAVRRRIPETADKVRQRLDKIFDDAAFFGRCSTNPARIIRNKISEMPRGRREGHYAALPYSQVPAFVAALRKQPGTSARALEFAILAAARTGEVLGATWDEIDDRTGLWQVPADRMKGREAHLVFLTPTAQELLRGMRRLGGIHLFPSPRDPRKPLSGMAMLEVLKRMKYQTLTTVHGVCRASFSTWANETAAARPDVIEACLAHREVDRIRASYNRASFDIDRKALLLDWSHFCYGQNAVAEAKSSSMLILASAARWERQGLAKFEMCM